MGKYKEATYKIILFLYKGNTSAGKVFMITDFFPIYKTLIHHPAPFRFLFLLKNHLCHSCLRFFIELS